MKKNFDIRLAALREYLRSLSADETVFIIEGGGEFRTAEDAFTYLRKYGAVTPDGKRIVLYPHPVEGVDPLSLSLYQMIDEAIEQGTSGFTGTRVSTKAQARSRRVAAQSLDANVPVYNDIPQLASGAVIPPNRKFLAVLGDQKSGTNVEAPLSTIKQAVMEALAQGDREPINVNLVVDGKTLARVVVPNINNMTRAAGKPVLLY